jgi:hypothetical protein
LKLNRHCEPTGPREARPDDRLHEAIHLAAWTEWMGSSLPFLAMKTDPAAEPDIITLRLKQAV